MVRLLACNGLAVCANPFRCAFSERFEQGLLRDRFQGRRIIDEFILPTGVFAKTFGKTLERRLGRIDQDEVWTGSFDAPQQIQTAGRLADDLEFRSTEEGTKSRENDRLFVGNK